MNCKNGNTRGELMSVGQELLNVPFAEMVYGLASAISSSQQKLDENSSKVAKFMAKTKIKLPSIDGNSEKEFPLIALGFFPGYYQFQEAIIEVKMAITMATSYEQTVNLEAGIDFGVFSASVNASYSSKYSYNVEGSSLLRVRLVPVPPPAILQQYMEAMMTVQSAEIKKELTATQPPA
jgi:hypothetical protein